MAEDEEIILNREKITSIFNVWKDKYMMDKLDFDEDLIEKDDYSERAADYFIRLFYELNPGV